MEDVCTQTCTRENQEMIVQWKICKDLRDKRRRVHIYELKEALSPECGTFESGDKVEDGDHENTFDRAVEVCQK